MVPNNGHFIEMGLIPCWLREDIFSTLSGLEVNMSQVRSKHGPDMAPKNRQSLDMGLRQCLLGLDNFGALAGLEVKLGQTWSLHGPDMHLK